MPSSFNKVILMGNLTRDPELRYTPQGTAVSDMTIAVNDPRGEKDNTVFADVTVWKKTAEACCQYLAKGRPVLIEGRLQQDTWEDRETGQKRSKLRVVAHDVQFLGSRDGGSDGSGRRERQASGSDQSNRPSWKSPQREPAPGDQEDIPF